MFYFCQTVKPQAKPCTNETFNEVVDGKIVADNCSHIKQIADRLPKHPTTEEWDEFKRAIAPYKAGDPKRGIPSLPGFCFHSSFPGGKRSNADAVLSGLISIDLDKISFPREVFETFKDDAIDMGLLLAYVSPSSKGLKLVFIIPDEAHSLEEAQKMIVSKLRLTDYADDATTDAARLSFAAPRSYILYLDEEELFADRQLPIGFLTKEDIAAAAQIDPSKESDSPLPKNEGEDMTYKGIPYKEIIDELAMRLMGRTEPEPGERNNRMMQALPYVRTICDDDYNKLLRVMPQWDPDPAKFRATIKNSQKYALSNRCFSVMEDIVASLKAKHALAEGKMNPWTMPKLPSMLPPVFREYAKILPPELKPAIMFSLMPMLGVYGSMTKVNINPKNAMPKYLTPSFITCIIAPPASGKSNISIVRGQIMAKLMEQDQKNIEIFNDWQQHRTRDDYKKKEPKMPIFNLPERLSMTSISKQMSNAAGRHIFINTPEIDTLKSSNGSGAWNDLSTIIRKSTDNDENGQLFMSSESFSCNIKIYLNILMQSQPTTMRKFFNINNVNNGLVDRVNFVELPDNTGMEEVYMRQMSDNDRKRIDKILDEMFKIGKVVKHDVRDEDGIIVEPAEVERIEVKLPRTLKALKKWGASHRENYMKSQLNPAEDHFYRRSTQAGIKAALLGYMTSGMKETTAVVKFAEWVAEYDLRMHVYLFGKVWNELQEKNTKDKADNTALMQSASKMDIFAMLPNEFCIDDLVKIEQSHGITDRYPNQKICRWRKCGFIKETDKKNGHKRVYSKQKGAKTA